MKRSIRKGPFIKKDKYTISKSSTITKYHFKKTFNVYNGKSFTEVEINNLNKVGYKFGEFVSTKKNFTYKKISSYAIQYHRFCCKFIQI